MSVSGFDGLGIDAKLLRALNKRDFTNPTPVQRACIPKALEGHDIVARAKTGTGKTMAYLIPALQRILQVEKGRVGWQSLILVPTKELCEQVVNEAKLLALACNSGLNATSLTMTGRNLRQAASTAGQIVVSTPGRVAELIKSNYLSSKSLASKLCFFVLDEADLLLSYGFEEDMEVISPCIPKSCQCMLTSATTSDDVEKLSKLILQNPVSFDLSQIQSKSIEKEGLQDATGANIDIEHRKIVLPSSAGPQGSLTEMTEKLLRLLTLLKYGLINTKVLIFVNSSDCGMRCRLFLEAFGIRCSELHAGMPLNSRNHALQQFSKGLFDYLIATDDVHGKYEDPLPKQKSTAGGRKQTKKKDEEFGVTRGIDFKGVKTVINLEMPSDIEGYVHRVGRTGRAGQSGLAISIMGSADTTILKEIEDVLASRSEETIKDFEKITKQAVEGLRYRGEDVAKSITKSVIREARARDVKAELMNSKRLASFFEERPADLQLLRHDRPVASTQAGASAPHLKHVPAYLRDPSLQGKSNVGTSGNPRGGFLPGRKRKNLSAIDPVKGFLRAPKRGGDHLYV